MVSSMTQIVDALSQVSYNVVNLNLECKRHGFKLDGRDLVDRTRWHKRFRPFTNVKTLFVGDRLAE
jgi:hypothetical protein